MKKNKKVNLSLVKSKIARLENPQMIKGGDNSSTNETCNLTNHFTKINKTLSTITSPIGTEERYYM